VLETMVLTAVAARSASPFRGRSARPSRPSESPVRRRPGAVARARLLTAGVLGLVGLVAGYFPAREASRLDPVIAMKL